MFDQPLLLREIVRRLLVRDFRCRCRQGETVAGPFVEAETRGVVLRLEAGQFVRPRFSRERRVVVTGIRGDIVDGVGDAVFGVGDECPGLFVPIRLQGQCDVRLAAAITDGDFLQHIAETIDLQRKRVLNARIGRIALIVVVDDLTRVGEEDRVAVSIAGLQMRNVEVLFSDGVREFRLERAIKGIDFLAQHRALEGAASFTFLINSQAIG